MLQVNKPAFDSGVDLLVNHQPPNLQPDELIEQKAVSEKLSIQLTEALDQKYILTQYIQSLESYLVKQGLSLMPTLDKNYQTEMSDMVLLRTVQPLLNAQARQIEELEQELEQTQNKLVALKTYSGETEKLHIEAIAKFQNAYTSLVQEYNQRDRETSRIQEQLQEQHEDRERINMLLKVQAESIESKNKLLLKQVSRLNNSIAAKDSQIQSLRQENTDLALHINKHQSSGLQDEQFINQLQEELKVLTSEHQKLGKLQLETLDKLKTTKIETEHSKSLVQAQQAQFVLQEDDRRQIQVLQAENRELQQSLARERLDYSNLYLKLDCSKAEIIAQNQKISSLEKTINTLSCLYESSCEREQKLLLQESQLRDKQQKLLVQTVNKTSQVKESEPERHHYAYSEDELELRVNKILLKERLQFKEQLKDVETSLKQTEQFKTSLLVENEQMKKRISTLDQDILDQAKILTRMTDEKVQIGRELYFKLDQEREQHRSECEQLREIRDALDERISDLQFELQSVEERCDFFRTQYEACKQQMDRIESDARQIREQSITLSVNSEKSLSKMVHENQMFQEKAQELQLELESLQYQTELKLSEMKQRHQVDLINWQSSLDKQERMTDRFRHELELTTNAYEKVITQLRDELRESNAENVHWRVEIKKASLVKQARIETNKTKLIKE